MLVDSLIDTFFQLKFGPLDEEEDITAARVYSSGSLRVTSFKDYFLIKLVPYPHKVPFDKFKVLFRNKNDVGDGYDDSSDDNSSDGGLEINESSDDPSSDDSEADRYLDFWF